jgi:hypothetical protein
MATTDDRNIGDRQLDPPEPKRVPFEKLDYMDKYELLLEWLADTDSNQNHAIDVLEDELRKHYEETH